MPVASLGQRSEDVGITARVRGQMLNAKDLNSNAFTITTHLGVVYILGIVTEQEAARAVELARNTQGVKRVVNMVDVISQAERPAQ